MLSSLVNVEKLLRNSKWTTSSNLSGGLWVRLGEMSKSAESQEEAVVPVDRLRMVLEKVNSKLDKESVLPWWALQYSLSEVGPSFRRMDPRELEAALHLLSNRPRPAPSLSHGPWEPRSGIYVAPHVTRTNAKHNAPIAAATKEQQLLDLASRHPINRANALAHVIAGVVEGASVVEDVDLDCTEHLGGGASWSRSGARLNTPMTAGYSSCIWVTDDLTWIFPDDARLWRHLLHCLETGQRPIVAARKIAVSTFPLLKNLGSFGVQLHHVYLEDAGQDTIRKHALVGGPPVLHPSEAADQVAVRETLANALVSDWCEDDGVAKAIRTAEQLGLHIGDGGGIDGLREWLHCASRSMPVPWKAQLTRYDRWKRARRK